MESGVYCLAFRPFHLQTAMHSSVDTAPVHPRSDSTQCKAEAAQFHSTPLRFLLHYSLLFAPLTALRVNTLHHVTICHRHIASAGLTSLHASPPRFVLVCLCLPCATATRGLKLKRRQRESTHRPVGRYEETYNIAIERHDPTLSRPLLVKRYHLAIPRIGHRRSS